MLKNQYDAINNREHSFLLKQTPKKSVKVQYKAFAYGK